MSTTRVRATTATRKYVTDELTPVNDGGVLTAPGDGTAVVVVPTDTLVGSSQYVSTKPFHVEKHITAGAGTSGSPWTGWESDLADAVDADRPVLFKNGHSNTASPLNLVNKRPYIDGIGQRATLKYSSSADATAVVNLHHDTGEFDSRIAGLYIDGNAHATYGIDLNGMVFSVLSNLHIGNTKTAGGADWAVNGDSVVANVIESINVHPDDGADVYGLPAPTNGMKLLGACNNLITSCSFYSPTAHLGAASNAGTGLSLGTSGVAGGSFQNLLLCFGATGYSKAVLTSADGYENTYINCDLEYSDLFDDSAVRTVLVNTGGVAHSAHLKGDQPTVIGGRHLGTVNGTDTLTISGKGATVIGNGNAFFNGGVQVVGTGSAIVLNPHDTLDWGPVGYFSTKDYKVLFGLLAHPQAWTGTDGDFVISHLTAGGHIRLGGQADDGTHTLDIGAGGVSQFVLKSGTILRGVNGSGNIADMLFFSGNDVIVGSHVGEIQLTVKDYVLFEVNGSIVGAYRNDGLDLLNVASVYGATRFVPVTIALTDQATITTNAAAGSIFTVTLGGSRTMAAPTNPVAGQEIEYQLKQDGTGSKTITWNSVFRFSGGTAPTLTTTAGKTDRIAFRYNGVDSKWDQARAAVLNL